jgi:SNF2 family DNA or RNA helicase
LNDFEGNYILSNYQTEPKRIDKIVSITDWLGKIKQEEWKTEFIPQKLMITWYLGETDKLYHFYCIYRRSQDKAVEVFAPKKGIITDFLTKDYKETEIDFTPYNEKSGRTLYPHQEDAVKFLVSRQKAILALDMGYGKTTTAIVASLAGGFNHTLIVCPASMKKTWHNELSMYVDKEDITIVEGKKWNDTKYTIINYDILDNFYKIPKQKIKTKELNVDDKGKVFTEVKEREIVSRSKKIIDESMENSQLFQAKYDLIIIDEAHRLSNNTSNRFKIIADLIKRSNPRGIFELTGTMITNSSKNLYNLLKLINVPITNDWEYYMTRFCGAKVFFKKNERNAYTTLFLQSVNKSSWYDLTYDEIQKLNEYLKKHCKKLCIPSEDTNMEELKEIIKPYYLRRLKSELPNMVEKRIKYLHYEMTREEKNSYDKLWDEYLALQSDKEKTEKSKQIIESSLMRQWLADKMIPKTISLARKCIELNHKVIIFCAYDNEIKKLRDEFGDICVYHNGKINAKKKDKAVEKFQTDDNVKVFIGNIFSAGVGLTLTAATVAIFNNFSFVPSDNAQAEDRIHRLNQTKPCTVYYQSFNGTYFDKMLEIVHGKEEVIDKIIVTEKEK